MNIVWQKFIVGLVFLFLGWIIYDGATRPMIENASGSTTWQDWGLVLCNGVLVFIGITLILFPSWWRVMKR